jgi:hypothetical protein
MSKIPVLVVAFKRPENVRKAIIALREYKPDKLYLECDGPRINKEGEQEAVEATRRAMLDAVDWPCELHTLFREENLGCAKAVYDAISWFFEHEEYGVIVEEDMIIGVDYYRLCEDLLPRYAKEDRVMSIQAINWSGRKDIPNTYVYSWRGGCNGWATWKRAWAKMDMSMSSLPGLSYWKIVKKFGLIPGLDLMRNYWTGYKHLDTFSSWAYRWSLSIQVNDGLSIVPGVNLGKDIGCSDGTHYDEYNVDPFKDLTIGRLTWPIVYNDSMIIDKKQKSYDIKTYYHHRLLSIKTKVRKLFGMKSNNKK